MEFTETAKITSKGQVTVPALVREILNLKKGSVVVFKITEKGVMFSPAELREIEPYTRHEWQKIERIVAEKGKIYRTAKGARKHIKSL
jgi:AbrB family looped-hinge helix DNA binding protein